MGEYEPNDSRTVTRTQNRAPGEPPRTGPQEAATRQQQQGGTELDQDERGEQVEQTVAAEQQQAEQREEAMERDADELDDPSRLDRND
jgi:hypothetical protein